MNYPTDTLNSLVGIRAASGESILIATTSQPITVLHFNFTTTAQNSQQVQCKTNLSTFFTFNQAIGTAPVSRDVFKVFPTNTVCYLKTFDATLSSADMLYVPYDLTQTSTSTVQGSGSTSSTVSTSSPISVSDTINLYFYGIAIFIAMLFFWRGRFKIDRYE